MTLAATSTAGDRESEAAAWGTACHEVAEDCLRTDKAAEEWIGRFVVTKAHRIEVDEELAETAQVYVDYVLVAYHEAVGTLWIEQNFSLAALNPPFDAGGTSDAVIWKPDDAELEVVDLKGGRGIVVEAVGNKQARTYGLGAVLAHPELQIRTVKLTIVQPRAQHPDGRIRSETISFGELIDWASELKLAWAKAHVAAVVFHAEGTDIAQWGRDHLVGGDHCTFCPAAGFCPELARKAQEKANRFFKDETGELVRNTPDRLTPEAVADILDHADMIQDWLNSVRSYAHSQAEGGVRIPNYQLVEKHGREKWRDDADQAVRAALEMFDVQAELFLNAPKLRTPKQVRKALSPELAKLVESYSTTPTAGTQLVRQDKTVREEVKPTAHKFFDVIPD